MKNRTNIVAVLFALSALAIFGCKKKYEVDTTKAFIKYYGGINSDIASDVIQTPDGGYVIAGTTTGASADMIIVKTNAEGNEEWKKTFGGPNYDECGSVALLPDGSYLLLGTYGVTQRKWNVNSLEITRDTTEMYAVRIDAQGNMVWERRYSISSATAIIGTFGRSIVVNDDGTSLLAGMIDSSYVPVSSTNTFVNLDMFALMIDNSNGNITQVLNTATSTMVPLRYYRYGSDDGIDIVTNAVKSSTGGSEYVMYATSRLNGELTPYVVKFRKNGIVLSHNDAQSKTDWSENTLFSGAQISKANNNNYLVTGTDGTNPFPSNIYMMELSSSSFFKTNSYKFGEPGAKNIGVSVIPTIEGGYALLGVTNGITYTGSQEKLDDVILIKLNPSGEQEWYKVFGGRGNDKAKKVIQTADGGYLICGTIAFGDDISGSQSSDKITLIKVDNFGEISNIINK